jgi:hypothetical protein
MATGMVSKRSLRLNLLMILQLLVCFVLSGEMAVAQVDQGAITGVIRDFGGAILPGAQVVLTNTENGLVLQRRANEAGIYIFSPIKIGDYSVSASAPGFQTTVQEHLHVDIQSRLDVDMKLKPGAVSDTVTVSTEPPLLQTQTSSVGQVISAEEINNTPLNGRNWVYIAHLTAGVAPAQNTSRGGGTGDFYANGQRAEQNNFILDGVDNNVNLIDFLNGASFVVRPPPDALAEFKIETSNYSAEYGHSAGSVVNASIKSGTNAIHGSAWEYFRNTVLNARDWDAPTVPKYNENQFGMTLGLPILRNKLFYFGDVEANRIVQGQTSTLSVPSPLERKGDFSELLSTVLTGSAQGTQLYQPGSGGGVNGAATLSCDGKNNVFCQSQIDPVAQRLLNLFPAPNANGGKLYNNYVTTLNNTSNTWQWDQRIDWNITNKDQAFGRISYLHIPEHVPAPLGPILDGSANFRTGDIKSLASNFMLSETHIFSDKLINEFRFGYNWGSFAYTQENAGVNLSAQLGLGGIPYGPNLGGLPYIQGTVATFGTPHYDPASETQNVYQILDNVTKIARNHSLKFGVNFQSIRFSSLEPATPRGNYVYSALATSYLGKAFTGNGTASFLSNIMSSAAITNASTVNDARWYRAAYVQDDWRVNQKFTINLGLRYDLYEPYKEMAGHQANFVVTSSGIGTGSALYEIPSQSRNVPLSPAFLSILTKDHITLQYLDNPALTNSQKTDFAPRIGFAYQVTPKTVVRSAYGIFYGGLQNQGGYNLGSNFPFNFVSNFLTTTSCVANSCVGNGITLENGFSSQISAGLSNAVSSPTVYTNDVNAKTAYTENYNLTLEYAFSNNMVASAAYVGNVARHVDSVIHPNQPNALQNPSKSALLAEPFPDLGASNQNTYNGVLNYNSLQAKLQRRLSHGLGFLATYTYAHALDNASDGLESGVSFRNANVLPGRDEYTNSPWDIRHRFTVNAYYQLPFGVGRAHLQHPGILDFVAGGWSINGTYTAQTGLPFSVSANSGSASGITALAIIKRDPFKPGGVPDPTNPSITCPTTVRNKTNWYNPCAFANPLPGTNIPTTGSGAFVTDPALIRAYAGGRYLSIYGPGYNRLATSLFKNFTVWREQYVQFRADIFNVLNHPSLDTPSGSVNNTGGLISAPKTMQNYTPDARFFQFSLKYAF